MISYETGAAIQLSCWCFFKGVKGGAGGLFTGFDVRRGRETIDSPQDL